MSEYVTVWVDGLPDLKRGEEIVRCRDCRHFDEDATPHDSQYPNFCHLHGIDMSGRNGFCAWGERK